MPPVSHQIRRAQKGDGAAAVAALADAFHDDPVMTWLLGTRVRREPKLRMMFGGAIGGELAKPDHLVDVGGDGMGVALWHEVDDWKSPDRPLRQVLPAAFRIFGWRLPMAMRVRPAMESVHPEAPHRYLAFIGVHRSKQGTGLGERQYHRDDGQFVEYAVQVETERVDDRAERVARRVAPQQAAAVKPARLGRGHVKLAVFIEH